jgi:hypothetical protein
MGMPAKPEKMEKIKNKREKGIKMKSVSRVCGRYSTYVGTLHTGTYKYDESWGQSLPDLVNFRIHWFWF